MKISDLFSTCILNLLRRKVRTILTIIGVIIGTCSIVVMISLGVGLNEAQQAALSQMGDLTLINIYNYNNGGVVAIGGNGSISTGGGSSQAPVLDDTAIDAIRAIDGVKAVTPVLETYNMNIQSGRYLYQGNVVGIDFSALPDFGYEILEGRYPMEGDPEYTMLFGEYTAYQFYDTKKKRNNYVDYWPGMEGEKPDPFVDVMSDRFELTYQFYGEDIPSKIPEYKMSVVGVLKGDAQRDYNTMYGAFVDINTLKRLVAEQAKLAGEKQQQDTGYQDVRVKVNSIDDVERVEQAINDMGFETYSMEQIRKPMQEQTQMIQLILGGIGGISLLVAAIGITNTMVMSIYERTREIGVMKVLGCKLGNIRTMFLGEAGFIGFFGGAIGIGISYGISALLNSFLSGFLGGTIGVGGETANISVIPFWLVLLGMAVATGVGLISGFYPANRAVKISALEAIKHE